MQPSVQMSVERSRGLALPGVLAGLFLILAAAVVGWYVSGGSTDRGKQSGSRDRGEVRQPVTIATVRRQDMPVMVQAVGTLSALNTANVVARVSGELQALHFDEGGRVSAGQLLAQIDPRVYEANVALAEGSLARDRAQLDAARNDLRRYRNLVSKDGVSRQQVDTQAALVRQLEGTVQSGEATLARARIDLDNTRVTAPIAGRVGLKQTDLGNFVQPGLSGGVGIVTITQVQPIALQFSIPSSRLPVLDARLRAGEPVPVEAWSPDGQTRLATGFVASIDNSIDPATDTIRAKAQFANDDESLFPNQPVSVRLRLDVVADALTVPRAAIMRGARGFYLYAVDSDDAAQVRVVSTGIVHDEWIVVQGPIKEGERVVIDGVDRLRAGAKVEIVPDDPDKRVQAGPAHPNRPERPHRRPSG